jgi:hypothetical protein
MFDPPDPPEPECGGTWECDDELFVSCPYSDRCRKHSLPASRNCEACRGNVLPGKHCYACGLEGPAGEGQALADLYEQKRKGR